MNLLPESWTSFTPRPLTADDSVGAGFWRRHTLPVTAVLMAWVLFGLIGHDPWKPDEAYTFGLVEHILKTGQWVVPTLAGRPFMEKPPLFFVTAAAFARLFGAWLAPYDGARLASGFYLALALWAVARAGRVVRGRAAGIASALLLAGTVGLLVDSHALITDDALLAGFALALLGLVSAREQPGMGGVWLGLGTGVGFLSKGLLAPGALGLSALLLPVVSPVFRTRRYLVTLAVAAVTAAPLLGYWPWRLYEVSPALFTEWWWTNNWGRFLGFQHLGPVNDHAFYLRTLLWYALPTWPLAAFSLWRRRRVLRHEPGVLVPMVVAGVTATILMASHDSRALYAMPLIPPLAVLAAHDFQDLPPLARLALGRVAALLFGVLVLALWAAWGVFWVHAPGFLHAPLARAFPGLNPTWQWGPELLAILATVLVGGLFVRQWSRDSGLQAMKTWTAGLTAVWVLLTTLWMPPINAVKTYRDMMLSLTPALPARGCIAAVHIGEPERALLEYYDGRETRPLRWPGAHSCGAVLVCHYHSPVPHAPLGPGYRRVWSGHRLGDTGEYYALFARVATITRDFPRRQSPSSRAQAGG